VLKGLKEREAALAGYDSAIAAKGDYAEAYANRGVVLQELERWEAALASYDRAISIRPDYAEAYFNRGTLLKALMQWEAAQASYDQAIALRPDYAEAIATVRCTHGSRTTGRGACRFQPGHPNSTRLRGGAITPVACFVVMRGL